MSIEKLFFQSNLRFNDPTVIKMKLGDAARQIEAAQEKAAQEKTVSVESKSGSNEKVINPKFFGRQEPPVTRPGKYEAINEAKIDTAAQEKALKAEAELAAARYRDPFKKAAKDVIDVQRNLAVTYHAKALQDLEHKKSNGLITLQEYQDTRETLDSTPPTKFDFTYFMSEEDKKNPLKFDFRTVLTAEDRIKYDSRNDVLTEIRAALENAMGEVFAKAGYDIKERQPQTMEEYNQMLEGAIVKISVNKESAYYAIQYVRNNFVKEVYAGK